MSIDPLLIPKDEYEDMVNESKYKCRCCVTLKSKVRQKNKELAYARDELKRIKTFSYNLQNTVTFNDSGIKVNLIMV